MYHKGISILIQISSICMNASLVTSGTFPLLKYDYNHALFPNNVKTAIIIRFIFRFWLYFSCVLQLYFSYCCMNAFNSTYAGSESHPANEKSRAVLIRFLGSLLCTWPYRLKRLYSNLVPICMISKLKI